MFLKVISIHLNYSGVTYLGPDLFLYQLALADVLLGLLSLSLLLFLLLLLLLFAELLDPLELLLYAGRLDGH